jgi:hypothetical protein
VFFTNLIIGAAMMLSVIMIAITISDRSSSTLLANRQKFAAESIAVELAFAVRKPEIFRRMVTDSTAGDGCNPTLACVMNNADCSAMMGGVFHPITCLYAIDDPTNRIFDSSIATNGFNMLGKPCNTFSSTAPDGDCIFRPTVEWRPLCTRTPCINEPVEIFVEVVAAIPSSIALNPNRRRMRVVVY